MGTAALPRSSIITPGQRAAPEPIGDLGASRGDPTAPPTTSPLRAQRPLGTALPAPGTTGLCGHGDSTGQHAGRDEPEHRGGPRPTAGGAALHPTAPSQGTTELYPGGPTPHPEPYGSQTLGCPSPHPKQPEPRIHTRPYHTAAPKGRPQPPHPSGTPIPHRGCSQPHTRRSPSPTLGGPPAPKRGSQPFAPIPAPYPPHPKPYWAPQPQNGGSQPHSPIPAEHQPHTWGSRPHPAAPGPAPRLSPPGSRSALRGGPAGGGGALRPFEFSLRPHNGAARSRPPRRLAPPPNPARCPLAVGGEGACHRKRRGAASGAGSNSGAAAWPPSRLTPGSRPPSPWRLRKRREPHGPPRSVPDPPV